jgi:hypothetical protein
MGVSEQVAAVKAPVQVGETAPENPPCRGTSILSTGRDEGSLQQEGIGINIRRLGSGKLMRCE